MWDLRKCANAQGKHIGTFECYHFIQKSVPNTPLRPHILAAFLPWGGFAGAGRPARRKDTFRFGKKLENADRKVLP
jgi:hypothetical protein